LKVATKASAASLGGIGIGPLLDTHAVTQPVYSNLACEIQALGQRWLSSSGSSPVQSPRPGGPWRMCVARTRHHGHSDTRVGECAPLPRGRRVHPLWSFWLGAEYSVLQWPVRHALRGRRLDVKGG
jgi:hypothetical protein